MARADQQRWDDKYRSADALAEPGLPDRFEAHTELFCSAGTSLEIACGTGALSVWLALNGVHASAYDISPVAIASALELASAHQVGERCAFAVADLDHGLPAGPAVDLVVCNMFRDARLDKALMDRLNPGGVLAVAALSEVGAEPGRFRVAPGELNQAFCELEICDGDEADGVAWIVAKKP